MGEHFVPRYSSSFWGLSKISGRMLLAATPTCTTTGTNACRTIMGRNFSPITRVGGLLAIRRSVWCYNLFPINVVGDRRRKNVLVFVIVLSVRWQYSVRLVGRGCCHLFLFLPKQYVGRRMLDKWSVYVSGTCTYEKNS